MEADRLARSGIEEGEAKGGAWGEGAGAPEEEDDGRLRHPEESQRAHDAPVEVQPPADEAKREEIDRVREEVHDGGQLRRRQGDAGGFQRWARWFSPPPHDAFRS